MSSVDISALGKLTPSQPLDFSTYPQTPAKSTGPKFTLAPAAEYDLRIVTPLVVGETLKASKTGNLNFKFDAEIIGGPHAGQKVRFQNASASVWERDGVQQSMLGNLVMALGGAEFPGVGADGDPTPQVNALQAVINNPFRAYVTWFAEDRKFGTGLKVKGMKNFPTVTDETGATVHQSFIPIDGQKNEKGQDARLYANLEIGNYVPATRR